MGIRDDEIQRFIYYGKGLGVKIIFYSKSRSDADADWTLDGSLIRIYDCANKSQTEIILDLIHEFGHHLDWINEKNRQPDLKFEEAIDRANLYQEDTDTPPPKHLRKKILDVEIAGTRWWDVIYKDVNIKIPMWKLEAARELDMWMYEMYYENGHFPKGKAKRERRREIQAKHRPS